ncbi:MAG TPA: copper resistance CopC family protein [Catenuloplanes sp.]
MRRSRLRHRAAGLLAAAAAALALVLATAGPAAADATLESSSPLDGATLDVAPQAVTLTFNEVVQARLATVALTDGTGATIAVAKAFADRATVIQPLPADLAAGRYTVAYRIVSADGHPVTGQVRFTLGSTRPAGQAAPSAAAAAPDTNADPVIAADPVAAREARAGQGAGARAWPWVAATAVLLLGVPAIAIVRRRRHVG